MTKSSAPTPIHLMTDDEYAAAVAEHEARLAALNQAHGRYAAHAPSRDLLDRAIDNGWSVVVRHLQDTGGHPYRTIEGRREEGEEFVITWHTRETNALRLSGAATGVRHNTSTLAKVKAYIAQPPPSRRSAAARHR